MSFHFEGKITVLSAVSPECPAVLWKVVVRGMAAAGDLWLDALQWWMRRINWGSPAKSEEPLPALCLHEGTCYLPLQTQDLPAVCFTN